MAALKKKTSRRSSSNSLADIPSSTRSAAPPMADAFSHPVNPGGMGFPNPADFNIPPFGAPMQGGPMSGGPMAGGPMPPPGMMPPMPGAPMPGQTDDLLTSVGNMLRLGVDAVSAALAGGTRIMQGFAGQGYHAEHYGHEYYGAHGMHHHGGHHAHGHSCGSHDPACCYPSCCDCYGEHCCHPSVHGCD